MRNIKNRIQRRNLNILVINKFYQKENIMWTHSKKISNKLAFSFVILCEYKSNNTYYTLKYLKNRKVYVIIVS